MAILDDVLCIVKEAAPPVAPAVKPPEPLPLRPVEPVSYRGFGDNKTMRDGIFNNVMDTLSTAYPLENSRYRLELRNVALDKKDRFSLADQKKAIMQGKSLERKITGEWHLFDKATNKLMDRKAGTIAHVPYATDRGTFIYRGNEYTVANQMRLRPGVYTRVKDNGTLEAHVNVKPGTGPSFRVYMEPQTGLFRLRVGQSTLKLYPILKAMGVQDRDIRQYWGNELLQANAQADDPGAVGRASTSLVNRRDLQEDAQSEQKANREILQLDKEKLQQQQSKAAADRTRPPTVAIDLDGTIATMYKKFDAKSIPKPRPGVQKALKEFQRLGYRIIIFTVRGDKKLIGDYLHKHDLPYDYINENPDQPPYSSGKVTADVYVDDRGISALPSWDKIQKQVIGKMVLKKASWQKEAKIGARESDRKWQRLWFRGTIRAEIGKKGEPWVYLDVHKGLVDAALSSLKGEGVECERTPNSPHITLVRADEAKKIYKKHGPMKWKGFARDGTPARFALKRLVSLSPAGWKDVDRVWFIECDSPDLKNYRKSLGLTPLPKGEDNGHEYRFHITFAVHKPNTPIKRAEEIFGCKRAAAGVGGGFTLGAPNEQGEGLLNVFNKMELDEDTTDITLGERHRHAGPSALLRTSQKLLNIFNKKEEIDDRDSLAFQTLHSPEDFFAERIRKDAGQLGRKMLWRSTLRGNVQHIPTGALTPQLYSVLLKSGMGMPVEEVNPMELYDQNLRILRLGEGGIPSLDAVPDEARNVQPSQFGFIDPIRAPESSKIGVDSRVAEGVVRGSDGHFYTSMRNPKTGQPEMVSAAQAAASVVAFPGEMAKDTPKVRAMVRSRQVQFVDRDQVDFELPKTSQMFTASSNMTPMVSGIKGGRLLMGAKYVIQSLPLKNPEAPLVQNLVGDEGDESFDERLGTRVGAVRARDRGVVTDVGKDYVQVRYADGTKENHELYQNFPFNRKTFLHNTPVVQIGDQIKPNQLLAKSNYTDDKGAVAMGNNLRVAYMPYKGLNYEDAVVVSESAAKMMSSEHMYQHEVEGDPTILTGRKEYVSIYPSQFNKEQLGTIDSKGVVKPGTVVKYGDPLILSLNKAKPTAVHRGHKTMFSDNAVTWNHEAEGVVTDIDKTKGGGYNVTVKAYMPAREGDKLAGRYGDKGVIAKIIPDDQMVHDKDGNPYHILLNPLGIISRGNPSQVHEALLGKIARKRGKAYKVPGFSEESMVDFVKKELQDAGMKDTDDVFDPTTGRKVKNILTGERFIYKLHHTAESKGRGRDVGAYTSEGLPAKGGEFGAKRISNMEINALLSHGATEVLRDAQVIRGQRNDDFWRAFRLGLTPPSPKVPMVYDKFLTHLQGAGINVKKDGERMQLFAMTDKDVTKLSSGGLTSPKTVAGDSLDEIGGGLFDRGLTGGHGGARWSHIELSEPIPNPVMEEPIRRLLNLTQNQYEQWIGGKVPYKGKYGGEAIHKALSDINLDDAIATNEQLIREGPRSKRDKAVKVLGYLKNMQKNKLRPEDWVMTKVPVIPPSFRPIGKYRDVPLVADANLLYQDLINSNDTLKEIREVVDVDSSADERLQVYNAFKAVTGLGDPVQAKTKEKKVKGLLKHVFGTSPKLGMFQRRVLGAPVDIVGRATITPNPDLNMDQVGLPEPKAWTIYRPFIMRRLVREGMPAMAAAEAVANQTPIARKALVSETQKRPVLINRAPTLHRYGFMAAWPVLTKGETLQISPVVTPGFNADFDGDAMNYHVPVTDEAVTDAVEKMLPSKNLKSSSNFKVHYLPKQEFLMGLYLASTAKKDTPPRVFASKADVIKAYKKGDISLGDRVIVK